MTYRVIPDKCIDEELESIYSYILNETEDERIASRVIKGIVAALHSLSDFPFSHRVHPEPSLSELGMRYVISGSYVILFTVDEDGNSVFVHHVRHVHQNVSALGEKKNSIGGFSDA